VTPFVPDHGDGNCSHADVQTRRELGCPPFEGQGTDLLVNGGFNQTKTCPIHLYNSQFVQSVLEDVEDYKRGTLGNVDALALNRLGYLRVATNTLAQRDADWQKLQISRAEKKAKR